jgi:hypothetical protein
LNRGHKFLHGLGISSSSIQLISFSGNLSFPKGRDFDEYVFSINLQFRRFFFIFVLSLDMYGGCIKK